MLSSHELSFRQSVWLSIDYYLDYAEYNLIIDNNYRVESVFQLYAEKLWRIFKGHNVA